MYFRNFRLFPNLWKRTAPFMNFGKKYSKGNEYSFGRRTVLPSMMATAYSLCLPLSMNNDDHKMVKIQAQLNYDHPLPTKMEKPKSIWAKFWNILIHVIRFFHLMLIFSPPILLSPLLLFEKTRSYWMDCFVKAVERSGVVFIKAFQYLSHRRDIIGPELADKFEYLRQKAPMHPYSTTEKYFKQSYGRTVEQIFDEFDPVPIASGSVSQVYKAKYKGKKVAIKVRHPNVDKYIERDINLLFFLSYLASFISPAMEIPVSEHSMKRTLTQQIDFTFEMKNLNKFNEMFKNNNEVYFPLPFEDKTVESVLVETFIGGIPVTYYQKQSHPLSKVIARLGSTTFFQMLMKNNFIHADCHGGNIFIEIKEQSYNVFTEIQAFIKETLFSWQTKIKSMKFDTQKMKKLYVESRQEELDVMKTLRKYKEKIAVNLIDVGMVIELNETDKKNFVNFLKSVIEGKGEMCAALIYRLSNFQGKKIMEGKFQKYHQQLIDCFSVLNKEALADVQGIHVFTDMLQIIRENRMKLDGQFATLLTNMIVLEAIAKNIDPNINILKCAFPYFKYVEDFGVYTK